MLRLGEKVYFSKGTEKNVKVTTIDDLEVFTALLKWSGKVGLSKKNPFNEGVYEGT